MIILWAGSMAWFRALSHPMIITATRTFTYQARTHQFLMIDPLSVSSYAHYYQHLTWEPSDTMIDFTPEYRLQTSWKQPSISYQMAIIIIITNISTRCKQDNKAPLM
jgi:hypothetical protein